MVERALSIRTVIDDECRLLTFRRPSDAIASHWRFYFAFGLFFTWLAGVGRYWDNPRADLWQYLGLGSIVYVFGLALVIWLVLLPLKPKLWSYQNVLGFIVLTSPPALLYAFPIERFVPLPIAQSVNAWVLGLVAGWRVALLVVFLRRVAGLAGLTLVVAVLLPLVGVVVLLAALNLEHVVFEFMSGMRPEDTSPNDTAYEVVVFISVVSVLALPALLIAYGWMAQRARRGI